MAWAAHIPRLKHRIEVPGWFVEELTISRDPRVILLRGRMKDA